MSAQTESARVSQADRAIREAAEAIIMRFTGDQDARDLAFARRHIAQATAERDARIAELEGLALNLKALCPSNTGGMSSSALAGLLFAIEARIDASLGERS